MTLPQPTPLGVLAAAVVVELAGVGLAIGLDAANPLYGTMAGVAGMAPVRAWGAWMVAVAALTAAAFLRQRRTGLPTRALYAAGNLGGATFTAVALSYAVHFSGVNTATPMYLTGAALCFFLAAQGDSPWAAVRPRP